jgi:hypothetical protein
MYRAPPSLPIRRKVVLKTSSITFGYYFNAHNIDRRPETPRIRKNNRENNKENNRENGIENGKEDIETERQNAKSGGRTTKGGAPKIPRETRRYRTRKNVSVYKKKVRDGKKRSGGVKS